MSLAARSSAIHLGCKGELLACNLVARCVDVVFLLQQSLYEYFQVIQSDSLSLRVGRIEDLLFLQLAQRKRVMLFKK